jgi:hypothetical protein
MSAMPFATETFAPLWRPRTYAAALYLALALDRGHVHHGPEGCLAERDRDLQEDVVLVPLEELVRTRHVSVPEGTATSTVPSSRRTGAALTWIQPKVPSRRSMIVSIGPATSCGKKVRAISG